MPAKVLITGGAGFLGARIVRRALDEGASVAVLCRREPPEFVKHETTVIAGSLEHPDWKAIDLFRPQVCIHCAWIATPHEYLQSPLNGSLARATVLFARRLRDFGLHFFVGMGSCAEYAPSAGPLREDDPEAGDATPYVGAKLHVLRFLQSEMDSSFAWLRLFYLYGPGESPGRFLTAAAKTLKAGGPFVVERPDDQVDYVHVDDAAEAVWEVVGHRRAGIYNVGSGQARTISSIAASLGCLAGHPERVHFAGQATPACRVANIEKLRATGWTPRRDFARALREIVARA